MQPQVESSQSVHGRRPCGRRRDAASLASKLWCAACLHLPCHSNSHGQRCWASTRPSKMAAVTAGGRVRRRFRAAAATVAAGRRERAPGTGHTLPWRGLGRCAVLNVRCSQQRWLMVARPPPSAGDLRVACHGPKRAAQQVLHVCSRHVSAAEAPPVARSQALMWQRCSSSSWRRCFYRQRL